jgi:hypothetical protein
MVSYLGVISRLAGLARVGLLGLGLCLGPYGFGAPALHPKGCDWLYSLVSKKSSELLDTLLRQHGLQVPEEGKAGLRFALRRLFAEYLRSAQIDPASIERAKESVVAQLGEGARAFADEWLNESVALIDRRFPLFSPHFSISPTFEPHYDLVREIVASQEWKKLSADKKADPVAYFRARQSSVLQMLARLPEGHSRKKALEADAARDGRAADAFEAFQRWERGLYQSIPGALGRGYPYGFADRATFGGFSEAFSEGFRSGFQAKVPLSLYVHGSSLTGLSHERKANGIRRPFGPHSDLDIVVKVSDADFAALKRQGLIAEEEPGKISIPYSIENAEALRKMGLYDVLKERGKDLPLKKISISFYSDSHFEYRKTIRPFLALP